MIPPPVVVPTKNDTTTDPDHTGDNTPAKTNTTTDKPDDGHVVVPPSNQSTDIDPNSGIINDDKPIHINHPTIPVPHDNTKDKPDGHMKAIYALSAILSLLIISMLLFCLCKRRNNKEHVDSYDDTTDPPLLHQ